MIKCNPGNKPCGKRCIGVDMFCRKNMSGGSSIIDGARDLKAHIADNTGRIQDLKKVDESELEYGDVVMRPLSLFGDPNNKKNFMHYAVYIGKGKVIQLGPDFENKEGKIRVSEFNEAVWNKVRPPLAAKKKDLEEIKKVINNLSAGQKSGKVKIKYDVMLSNCERFANLVTYGVPYSSQYDELGEGAKTIAKNISAAKFGSFKGKSISDVFAHALKYKKRGGIRKMPPLTANEIIGSLSYAEFGNISAGGLLPEEEYKLLRNRLASEFEFSEVAELDSLLETLNTATLIKLIADEDF